jgi:hypothetical protein
VTSQDAPPSDARSISRKRVWGVRLLTTLGTILLLVTVLAIWVNRTVLDNEGWTNTTEQLLDDPEVQQALSLYLTDQLYANVDVQARLQEALPPDLQALAPLIAGGLRETTPRLVDQLLDRPVVIAAFADASSLAQAQFIRLIDDRAEAIRVNGGQVTLELKPLLERLNEQTGVGGRVAARIPEGSGTVVLLESDQLESLQTLVRVLNALALWLWIVVLALFALALYLSHGRRRETLKGIAFGWLLVGVAILALIRLGVPPISDTLTDAPVYKDAAQSALDILLSPLRDGARTITAVGLIALLGAWVAGPGRRATQLRNWVAPVMRDRPDIVWGVFALVVLVIIAWGPTPATRSLLWIVVFFGLAALGLEILRRIIIRESGGEGGAPSLAAAVSGTASKVSGRIRGRHDDGGDAPKDGPDDPGPTDAGAQG